MILVITFGSDVHLLPREERGHVHSDIFDISQLDILQ